jgi:hypothetical protein
MQRFREEAMASPTRRPHFGPKEWNELLIEGQNWRLSQFMHGEQGALLCTAKIVETVPWIDAKYYASTQVMDEARHVEVFAKYLDTKLTGHYPINAHLKMLLDDIIRRQPLGHDLPGHADHGRGPGPGRLRLHAHAHPRPLLKQLLRYVMSDEARHVAFGVLSLKEYYDGLSDAEMRERQEFAFEAAVRMRDRFLQQEVWERMGIDSRPVIRSMLAVPPEENMFQQMLFSKIVPNCRKLGLLDASGRLAAQRVRGAGRDPVRALGPTPARSTPTSTRCEGSGPLRPAGE